MRTPLSIEGATAPPQVLGLTEADAPLCLASQWDTAPALRLAGGSYSCQINVKHEKAMGYLPGLIQLPLRMAGGGFFSPEAHPDCGQVWASKQGS